MNGDDKWMKVAIQEAIKAKEEGEVPVGAILVKDDIIIAKAHNQPILKNDATAHAEVQLIRAAGLIQKNYRLTGTSLFVTLEPCMMCLGAIMHARIARIVYGANDQKKEVCGPCSDLSNATFFKHNIDIYGGVLKDECSELLKTFFQSRRY
jgi:tRNA(adenine34) deaminase